jgi:hypothetical protein
MKTFLQICVLLAGAAAGLRADIDLTLTNANLTATPGGAVTFTATAFNPNSFVENLNTDSFNVDSPLMVDDSPFLSNWFSINGNSPFDTQADPLFNVNVPSNAGPGMYNGAFTILGGPSPSDQNVLATADFTVTINGPSAVPEPAAWILLGTVVALVFVLRRRGSPSRRREIGALGHH